MKDSEVASCCSLRKWQAKTLSACDSGCLRLGMGEQPSTDRSSHAQGQLEVSTAGHEQFVSSGSDVVRE